MMITTEARLAQFREDGYTVFEGVHPPALLHRWREVYDDVCRREGTLVWLGSAFEIDPELFLPAIAAPVLLDFAERVMGPFVQLDDVSINAFPSVDAATAPAATAWHRDRYSEVPQTRDYVHPLACNTIFYLQDLNPERGPLRVVPGSHRQPIVFTPRTVRRGVLTSGCCARVPATWCSPTGCWRIQARPIPRERRATSCPRATTGRGCATASTSTARRPVACATARAPKAIAGWPACSAPTISCGTE